MTDFIIIAVLVVIVGAALAYIIKKKKSGAKCIGCPDGGSCCSSKSDSEGGCPGCCSCGDNANKS